MNRRLGLLFICGIEKSPIIPPGIAERVEVGGLGYFTRVAW